MDNSNLQTGQERRSSDSAKDVAQSDSSVNSSTRDHVRLVAAPEQFEVPSVGVPFSIAKRIFDIVGALLTALFSAPIMIVIAVVIRFGGQPVIFSHKRIGKNRKAFQCYKFRSMVPNAEEVLQDLLRSDPAILREWRESHKLRDDPRITKFGEFLRRSSLDELPQLWNVLKGDMSLVGPRPVVEDELERYGSRLKYYLVVKPGMSGLWQVMGRSNVTYSRRVSLDVLYVRKQSIRLDIWVLFRTLVVVFKRLGAH